MPALLLQLLLRMAGIESNPGPLTWQCSVCKLQIRRNVTSVNCNSCRKWCHFQNCSKLKLTKDWNNNYIAPCCHTINPHITQNNKIQNNNHNYLNNQHNHNQSPTSFHIIQLNCNGLTNKIAEITDYLDKNHILICAIQETKLTSRSQLKNYGNFTVIRQDRTHNSGGGLAFMIHKSVKYKTMKVQNPNQNDRHLEQQAISVSSGKTDITIYNIYIPPVSSCDPGYIPSIEHILVNDDTLVLGDINAHHEAWHSNLDNDRRGIDIAQQIDNSIFSILNEQQHTRISSNCFSSPDISLASPSLLTSTTWSTTIKLGSDHLPITITIERAAEYVISERRTFINFNKANWANFTAETERQFNTIPVSTNVLEAERTFRLIICKAMAHHIPAGRIPTIRPNFPSAAAILANERDLIRSIDPSANRIQELNVEIQKLVDAHRRKKWIKHLENCDLREGVKKLWSTVKSLSNPTKSNNHVAINFEGTSTVDSKKCSTLFNRQFIEHPLKVNTNQRATIRAIHNLPLNNNSIINCTVDKIASIIKSAKSSKALGPDGISTIVLKHIGPAGLEYLTNLFNLSLSSLTIPDIWKIGRVIPLLKAGKSPDEGKSYRPITLLSPVVKTLESVILPFINEHLLPMPHQHGFRKHHSTTTALHTITNQVTNGLNQRPPPHRTLLVALDLSKAFDTVSHSILLKDLLDSTLPNFIKRWLCNYLRGRQSFVEFRNTKSKCRKVKQGVPQGGVLSPTLFNYYISKLPTPPNDVNIVSYADDCTVLTTGPNTNNLCLKVNAYLEILHQFFVSRNMQLSTEKSTATLFTTWTAEFKRQLNVTIAGRVIPTVNNPKILGIVFDNMLTFSTHANYIRDRLRNRNNILKSLAGSTWGKDKETLLTTYKAIGRSVLNYAAPIWTPQLRNSHWKGLQTSQNAAMRVITGCHLMSDEDHLHNETKLLSVKQHNYMLSRQYLLACHLPNHPNHNLITQHSPPRNIRNDVTKYKHDIKPQTKQINTNIAQYNKCLNDIHCKTVVEGIRAYKPNIVLGGYPPPISASEISLPRSTRTTLAQLRSGWCRLLKNYIARLDPNTTDLCPDCGTGPHDVHHLFQCPNKPTNLRPIDLWLRPIDVAGFLVLDVD